MDIKDRIKAVRLENGLSQSDFARRIGIAQNTYSKIETGASPVQERYIISICSEFGISESWLRTGEGDMYADEDAMLLESLSKRYTLTEDHLAILRAFLKLDADRRDALLVFARAIIAEQEAAESVDALIDSRISASPRGEVSPAGDGEVDAHG